MNILIVDDDVSLAKMIETLVRKNFPEFEDISLAHSVAEGKKILEEKSFDLLLLDVNLQDGTSFDFIDPMVSRKSKIIFITGHENYAIEAIKLRAVDYMLKPISISEFKLSVLNAINEIKGSSIKELVDLRKLQERTITLKDMDSIKIVKLSDILFFEASGPYTNVCFSSNESFIVTKHLKEFETKLSEFGFYRVHNSFLVNTLCIEGINKKEGFIINLMGGKTVAVSSRKKEEFMKYIENLLDI